MQVHIKLACNRHAASFEWVLELPVTAFGHTIEEALEMAKEAIEVYIESLAARGKEIPIEEDQIEATVTVEANA